MTYYREIASIELGIRNQEERSWEILTLLQGTLLERGADLPSRITTDLGKLLTPGSPSFLLQGGHDLDYLDTLDIWASELIDDLEDCLEEVGLSTEWSAHGYYSIGELIDADLESCECCYHLEGSGDNSSCRDYYGHDHGAPDLPAGIVFPGVFRELNYSSRCDTCGQELGRYSTVYAGVFPERRGAGA